MILIAVVLSFVVTVALTPLVRRLGLAVGAVEESGRRPPDQGDVPSLGGVAAVAGIAAGGLALAITGPAGGSGLTGTRWAGLAAGVAILLVVGAYDDVRPLSAWAKLGAQVVAAGVAVSLGLRAEALANPFSGEVVQLGWAGTLLSALWIVSAINAFNLIDGLDGLCAGIAAIAAATLAIVAGLAGQVEAQALMALVAAASAGFLIYNWHPARIFPGDSGSLSLGFLLGAGALWAVEDPANGAVSLAPAILALAVPLADMVTAVLRRLFQIASVARHAGPERESFTLKLAGRPRLFTADRDHVHHRLLDRGYRHRVAVVILLAFGLAGGLGAVAGAAFPEWGPAVLAAAIGLGLYLVLFQLRYQELRVLRGGLLLPFFSRRIATRRGFHTLVDAVIAALAFGAAYGVVHGPEMVRSAESRMMLAVAVAVELIVFYLSGLYRGAYRHAGVGEALRIVRSTSLAAVAAAAGLGLSYGLSRSELAVYVINGLLLVVLVLGSRLSFRVLDYVYEHGREGGLPTLLYGTGRGGDLALREILANPGLNWRPVGFIDDQRQQHGRYRCGYPVLGSLAELSEIVARHGVRHVVVTTRKLRPAHRARLSEIAARHGVAVTNFAVGWEPVLSGEAVRSAEVLSRQPDLAALEELVTTPELYPDQGARLVDGSES